MPRINNYSSNNLQSSSKKIKKASPATKSENQASESKKKYKTFTKKEKLTFIQRVMTPLDLEVTEEDFDSDIVLECLEDTSLEQLNSILVEVLAEYIPSFGSTSEELRRWRSKLRGWIKSFDKPETRGGVVVTDDKLLEFKALLIPVLMSLPRRSYDLLRPQVVAILLEMGKVSACSKHFWYDFLKRNPDIKEIYYRNGSDVSFSETLSLSDNIPMEESKTETTCPTPLKSIRSFESLQDIPNGVSIFRMSSPSTPRSMEEEEEKTKEIPKTSSLFVGFPLDLQAPQKYDFYRSDKRIVETEDNEYQRKVFGRLWNKEIDLNILMSL